MSDKPTVLDEWRRGQLWRLLLVAIGVVFVAFVVWNWEPAPWAGVSPGQDGP